MPNIENLKPSEYKLSLEEAKRGGIASGEARRKKKTIKQQMELLMQLNLKKGTKTSDTLSNLGIPETEQNIQMAVVTAQMQQAMKGNTRAFELIQNTLGQNPLIPIEEEKKDKQTIYIPAKDMTTSFVDLNRDIDSRKHQDYWIKGGRGSIKSSFISLKIIEILENNPNWCAIVIRKVGNTLKDSVYSQIEWAISKLDETYPGLAKDYKFTKSPLEITKISTGQKIYFRGADDPVKIKSIKPPINMYIAVHWYEEFDQMAGMNEIRKIDQSILRGGNEYVEFRSYNTPPSTQHFTYKESIIPKENRLVHLSDYRAVPIEWLGQPFIDEAEYIKSQNEDIYNNEYLGLATGEGTNVFNNIELREITDEEIEEMDRIYQGIDFGWYPDPLVWTKCYFKANTRELYILDEFVVNKMSNAAVWENLHTKKGVEYNDLIIADSAEPKSIADFRSYGASMRGAEKGPDSVSYSMKWLASLSKIVIDGRRTPVCMDEFCNYEYEKDKDGNVISGYVDANNHCIDSVRYSTNSIWKHKGQ